MFEGLMLWLLGRWGLWLKKFARVAPVPNPDPYTGPEWLPVFYADFAYLWDAVRRLERMNHRGMTSAQVGGPVLISGGSGDKSPPPPPPMVPPA